jgi:hypothetical protein
MQIKALLWVVLIAPVAVAESAVYRCMVDGKPTYTDQPCGAGAKPHEMPAISTVPSPGESDLAQEFDARRERESEAKQKDDKAWLEDHAERKALDARMNAAIAERKVLKDMSPDQVRRALGSPDEVERKGGSEEWIYGTGKQRRTVQFEGGKVVRSTGKK